jgi:hypothetical protein
VAVSEFPDWESYFWPGSKVLLNLLGERDQDNRSSESLNGQ